MHRGFELLIVVSATELRVACKLYKPSSLLTLFGVCHLHASKGAGLFAMCHTVLLLSWRVTPSSWYNRQRQKEHALSF